MTLTRRSLLAAATALAVGPLLGATKAGDAHAGASNAPTSAPGGPADAPEIPAKARAFLYRESFDEAGLLQDSTMEEVPPHFDIATVPAPARLSIVWDEDGVYRERQIVAR